MIRFWLFPDPGAGSRCTTAELRFAGRVGPEMDDTRRTTRREARKVNSYTPVAARLKVATDAADPAAVRVGRLPVRPVALPLAPPAVGFADVTARPPAPSVPSWSRCCDTPCPTPLRGATSQGPPTATRPPAACSASRRSRPRSSSAPACASGACAHLSFSRFAPLRDPLDAPSPRWNPSSGTFGPATPVPRVWTCRSPRLGPTPRASPGSQSRRRAARSSATPRWLPMPWNPPPTSCRSTNPSPPTARQWKIEAQLRRVKPRWVAWTH